MAQTRDVASRSRLPWAPIEEAFEALSYHLYRLKYSQYDVLELRRWMADVDLLCLRLFDEIEATDSERRTFAHDALVVVIRLDEFVRAIDDEDRWIHDRLSLILTTIEDIVELLSPIVAAS